MFRHIVKVHQAKITREAWVRYNLCVAWHLEVIVMVVRGREEAFSRDAWVRAISSRRVGIQCKCTTITALTALEYVTVLAALAGY